MPQQQFTKELENVYDKARKIDRFFDKKTPTELFRGIKKSSSDGLMQPTLIGFHLKRGPRRPDVLFHDSKGITPQYEGSDNNRALILDDSGELTRHILANAGDYVVQGCRTLKGDHRGMSLFDKKNPRLSFKWYCIPANADIPPGIAITRDSDDLESDDPIHYTAAPKDDMPLSLFLQHLKDLAVDVKPA